MRPKRLLALAVHPASAAATRFRVEALRDALAERSIELTLATSLDEQALSALYQPGALPTKALHAARSTLAQWDRALRAGPWDGVFVQREAGLVGPPILEWFLRSAHQVPMFFDFDDAIWLPSAGASRNPIAARLLKFPRKTWWLMRHASHVFAGSEYLAAVARQHNANVTVAPTVVSHDRWTPAPGRLEGAFVHPGEPIIGFVGSHSTAPYVRIAVPALQRLRDDGYQFRFRVVGADSRLDLPIQWENVRWSQEHEVDLFHDLDIGIAPLPDNEWTRGKCAFKQIQYLTVGVPCVTSPIGPAASLVEQGVALGAWTTDDWYKQLHLALTETATRKRLATAGRALIEERLSSKLQSAIVSQTIDRTLRRHRSASGD